MESRNSVSHVYVLEVNQVADTIDVLLQMYVDNWTHVRHSDDQRATMTNLIFIVASIINGVLTQTGFSKNALPLTILLILLGLFGMLASAKLYEQSKFHVERARQLRLRLDELCPDAKLLLLRKAAEDTHNKEFPMLVRWVPLEFIWIGLHILILILGITYTAIILIR